MSASDAAPLPRLGEVFFDVRGDSRSMRLSWYADTGIAVFSIWQGGMCTGTFRLPMDDLSRMIEVLRRGPQSKGGRRNREPDDRRPRPGQGQAGYGADPDATQFSIEAVPDAGPYAAPAAARGPSHDAAGADTGYEAPGYETGGYQGSGGYETGGYQTGGYEASSYEASSYEASGYERGPGGRHGGQTADFPAAEYADADREFPTGSYWPDRDGYPPDATGQQRFGESGSGGYSQDRFVPPYVGPPSPSYLTDNPADGLDHGAQFGRDAYPDDRQSRASAAAEYPHGERPGGGYFDRPDYLLTADPAVPARHSAGRHASEYDPLEQAERDIQGTGNQQDELDYRGWPPR
jgi:hypothetical protein